MSLANIQKSSLTIVTGADSKYFRCLYQFLQSITRHKTYKRFQIEIYDLGLTLSQRNLLENKYASCAQFSFQDFPFEQYPEYFKLKSLNVGGSEQECHGSYAWKPAIIANVLAKTQGCVLWLDSATIIRGQLTPIIECLECNGVYVPFGGTGLLSAYTHADTLNLLKVPTSFYNYRIRAAGVCGFNYNFSLIRQLVHEWYSLALVEECISPKGSSLQNHRYEQSILTILLYQLQHQHSVHLTEDALDISSPNPIAFLSTRNKVSNRIPSWLDSAVRAYYFSYKTLDTSIHRIRLLLGNQRKY